MSAYGKMGRVYYAGDPGLGGFLKKVAGAAVSLIPGGGIARTVLKTAGGLIVGGTAAKTAYDVVRGPTPPMLPVPPGGAAPPLQVGPVGINLPGFQGPGMGISVGNMGMGNVGPAPRGYRPNKTGYFLKDGTYVAPGTRYVKIRRRNPLNPRAADRAISRLESAKKATKRLGRVSIRKSCPT